MYLSMFLGPLALGFEQEMDLLDLSVEQAMEADEAGFTAIYVGEQHHNGYEPYSDPFGLGGYLAGKLTNAYVGTSVVPLVLHHPLKMIERINLLDQLTRGKCVIGMSSGQPFNGTAFHIHEWSPDVRQQLFDQKLDVMLKAWAHEPGDGPLEFATDAEQGVMSGRIMPYSYRAPRPLFAISTNTPEKLLQAGRDGHLVHLGPFGLDQAIERSVTYRQGLEQGGHSVDDKLDWLFSTKWIYVGETDDAAYAEAERFWGGPRILGLPWLAEKERFAGKTLRELHECDPGPVGASAGAPETPAAWVQRCQIIGSPETVARELQRWDDAGFRHIHARWVADGIHRDLYRQSWRRFVDEVMPRLNVERIPSPAHEAIRPAFRGGAPNSA